MCVSGHLTNARDDARWPNVEPAPLALAIKPDLERMLLWAENAKQKAEQLIQAKSKAN